MSNTILWIVTSELHIEAINNLPVVFPQLFACLPKLTTYLLVACLAGFLRGQEMVHIISTKC